LLVVPVNVLERDLRRRRSGGRCEARINPPANCGPGLELSTDWDTALLVADRYSGPGDGGYFGEQAKRVLAAMLLIANRKGLGYGWINEVLGASLYTDVNTALERMEVTDVEFPLRVLMKALWSAERECSAIYSTAYLMFNKALQPRSTLDPDLLAAPPPPRMPAVPNPYGEPDTPPNPFPRGDTQG